MSTTTTTSSAGSPISSAVTLPVGRSLRPLVALVMFALASCVSDDWKTVYQTPAALTRISSHAELQGHFTKSNVHQLGDCFVLEGHTTADGTGLVLASRHNASSRLRADSSSFEYLTIYIRHPGSGKLTASFPQDAMAFYSSGNLDFPSRSGCVGYAPNGSIEYEMISDSSVRATVNLELELLSPRGYKGECSRQVVNEKWIFKRVSRIDPAHCAATPY